MARWSRSLLLKGSGRLALLVKAVVLASDGRAAAGTGKLQVLAYGKLETWT